MTAASIRARVRAEMTDEIKAVARRHLATEGANLSLRAVARDRAPVSVLTGGDDGLTGTIDRVGADFVELAAQAAWEQRRGPAVRSVLLVPLGAIRLVRAQPLG